MGSESLSSAFGWVSIACGIVVVSPQVIENYQLQSGEGLSLAFVIIWLLGDLCNLVGAVMAGLQTTIIILAIYYSLCDITLLTQVYYYRYKRHLCRISKPENGQHSENGEEAPLLGARAAADTDSDRTPQTNDGIGKAILRYVLALLFVIGVGLAAWFIEGLHGEGSGGETGRERDREKDVIEWKSQVIGWTSALLYLGSRIPQILKNFESRCEGLSLALFLFTMAGNVTYVLSICTESMEPRHLIANASWLAGSGLTVFLDVFVLCQFMYFHRADAEYIRLGYE